MKFWRGNSCDSATFFHSLLVTLLCGGAGIPFGFPREETQMQAAA